MNKKIVKIYGLFGYLRALVSQIVFFVLLMLAITVDATQWMK